MIILDCTQGSAEWFNARLGIPTASRFDKIITAKTMKASESARPLAYELVAELFLGTPLDDGSSIGFMQRGQVMEEHARRYYELVTGADVQQVGFVLREDRLVGCSPDGFVGDDGMIEIKCPTPGVHIGYLLDDGGIGHRQQVQGMLYLTGKKWCDTVSYHPELPSAVFRTVRDEVFVRALAPALDEFTAMMRTAALRLLAKGIKPKAHDVAKMQQLKTKLAALLGVAEYTADVQLRSA